MKQRPVHNRVLFLGTTGTAKRFVADRLIASRPTPYTVIDFEKEYLPRARAFRKFRVRVREDEQPPSPMLSFLNRPKEEQFDIWHEVWSLFSKDRLAQHDSEEGTILLLHAVVVSDVYGARSVVDIPQLCKDFKPTLIITLIDDVFNAWWRTEGRAKANTMSGGDPSFEQLIIARRTEMMLGDMIALQSAVEPMCRHIVLSVHHPIDTLWNLVANDAYAIYLSFPISQPRQLLEGGDPEGQQAINAYHHEILRRQNANPNLAFISPLAIDELPFAKLIEGGLKSPGGAITQVERWCLSELWGDSTALLSGPPPKPVPIDPHAAENVLGLLKTDVGWRDYRLVSQSAALAVYCPVLKGRDEVSRGVNMEVQQATREHIPSFIYQNPEWDPNGLAEKILRADAGAMGTNPQAKFQHLFVGPDGLSQMLDTLCRDVRGGIA